MNRTGRDRLSIIALAGALALFYYIGTCRCYSIVDDSLPFLLQVHGGSVVIVHHLILGVLRWLNRLLGFTGQADLGRTLILFRIFVVGSSFLTLCLVGLLSREWFGSLRTAVVTMLLTGFTCGFWLYSMVTDIPVPAVAFALLAVYFAARSFDGGGRAALMLVFSSLALLIAALNHQAISLVVLPITVVLLLWPSGSRKSRIVRAGLFFGGTAVLGLVTFYVGFLHAHTGGGFLNFLRGYEAGGRMYTSDQVGLVTPVHAVIGISRAFFYFEYALHIDSAYRPICARFPFKLLGRFRYLVRDLPDPLIWASLALSSVLLIALFLLGVRALRRMRGHAPAAPGFWMVLAWIVPQSLFSTWWLASSREFWIWMIPCLSLVGTGLAITSLGGRAARILPWALVVALCGVNLSGLSKLWNPNNCLYGANMTYRSKLRPNDLMVTTYRTPYLYAIGDLPVLHPSDARMFECKRGEFSFEDPALTAALEKVRCEGGGVFLDPILVMPDSVEILRMNLKPLMSRATVEPELLRLESFCEAAGVPLYGVERTGGAVIAFHRCRFRGYLKWVDSDLHPL